jgi:hypothetical protein
VSGTIVKPSDIRVEEIALRVWGRRREYHDFADELILKKGSGHTTRFFFSPSISNNSPGMRMAYGGWRTEQVGGISSAFARHAFRMT